MTRPLCDCGNLRKPNGYRVDGTTRKYYTSCSPCLRARNKQGVAGVRGSKDRSNLRSTYAKYKKNSCELCGFIPEHSCQLDVDHMDGNKSNNISSNLQTLCANCHRLKSYRNNDWKISLKRPPK